MYLNLIKAIYNKPTANIVLNGERLKAFPLKSGTRMPTLTTFTQHSTGNPSHSNQTYIYIYIYIYIKSKLEEVKLSPYADDIILYIENSKDSTKKSTQPDK